MMVIELKNSTESQKNSTNLSVTTRKLLVSTRLKLLLRDVNVAAMGKGYQKSFEK
jgi:hypothetical protein